MSRIALITGGSTSERTVALAGARQVTEALRARGHAVTVVDTAAGALSETQERELLPAEVGTSPPTQEELKEIRRRELGARLTELPEAQAADLCFFLLHGRQGEGGQLQALFDLAGLLYTGSDQLGSTLAMDKDVAKKLCRAAGIPTADWRLWPLTHQEADELGYPLIVKPVNGGSSVGLAKASDYPTLRAAVDVALSEDPQVMVETVLPGRELTVGILGDRALGVGEIVSTSGVFDYYAKYTPGVAREIFPADVPKDLEDTLRQLAHRAHRALKLRDFSRIDFRLDAGGQPHFLEANTLPGMTSNSLLPQSAAVYGIGFEDLCEEICRLARDRASA